MDIKPITLKEHFELGEELMSTLSIEQAVISYNEGVVEIEIEALKKDFKVNTGYDDITFCQLIVIEQIMASPLSISERILKALTTFYRPTDENVFDNDDSEREERLNALFNDMSAGVCLTLFDKLTASRKEFLFEKFEGVIYSNKTEQTEEVDKQEAAYDDVFYKIFGWYERQRSIAKELNMQMKDVLLMRASDALFELAYQKEKIKLNDFYDKQRKR